MFNTKEKQERSLGTKLFLKAARCNSPKCVSVRRPQRPGLHGKSYKTLSEFGQQLKEKQKIRFTYGIREAQMELVFKKAAKNPGVTGEMIISILERRLDNVVYRLGIAPSRSVGRQLVGHGHILVNGHKVTIPSYQVRVGDTITIRPQSNEHPLLKDLGERLEKYEPPVWLALDAAKLEGKVLSAPKDFEISFDVNMVVDYYSK
ncbi:MAG: 30S ribosomal protein S4 [Candidatus Harrisonbacteria bacterium RIFOXYA1_FULL_48_8]|uniref:Small ribosomal subunit protein uS4 n=3 Tax=Parcubacteria group TaxID=1794811 RepID=A0A0G1W4F6_9BACT|nr:MAG: 30S ribosomal protein S4 [Candidatus Giovannonibacteria bacterium GW2011_GWB1_47_6b]KKU92217.1 MAG: 30S ribosomal protein S4 [Parcubacteria group bacterium GW2011_GWA1_48_11b]OGY64048.1 MAG: 30S ribosomal protein S4 [Candidatus Harrisonbacteria bacterium RIFCSPHIGHO2_12_FULL_48_16]OGY69209.1 MAG: 30S ribosomal protein S4 [Candidatus Harrisonbacteria bacterium RIFOXYA1_FULL_48_8]